MLRGLCKKEAGHMNQVDVWDPLDRPLHSINQPHIKKLPLNNYIIKKLYGTMLSALKELLA